MSSIFFQENFLIILILLIQQLFYRAEAPAPKSWSQEIHYFSGKESEGGVYLNQVASDHLNSGSLSSESEEGKKYIFEQVDPYILQVSQTELDICQLHYDRCKQYETLSSPHDSLISLSDCQQEMLNYITCDGFVGN